MKPGALLSPQSEYNLTRLGAPVDDRIIMAQSDGVETEGHGDIDIWCPVMEAMVPPPPEITSEMQRPRMMRAPCAPSRQERAEHDISHCPFRVWCEKCVAGKSHAKAHFIGKAGSPDGEVPLVAFDYAFMSNNKSAEKQGDDKEREASAQVKILVGRDRKSKCYAAIPVPCKGVDEGEYATRRVLRFLDFLGYDKVILKSDQEYALGKVLRSAKIHRGEGTQTMLENSPVGDSRSNGFIECAVERVEGQVRTMKLALEERIGIKIPADSCVLPWLVEHAGNLLTMFEVSDDGKNHIRGSEARSCALSSLSSESKCNSCRLMLRSKANWSQDGYLEFSWACAWILVNSSSGRRTECSNASQ